MSADLDRPVVFVTVGTDHHPFDRLLSMVRDWAADRPDVDVLVQSGHTTAPAELESVAFMDASRLATELARASAVVCHGGPSTIMEARSHGHVPIVVARDPDVGEHVDGHQLRFTRRVGQDGLVVAVQTPDALGQSIDAAIAHGPPTGTSPDRPEALASIARIGALLDDLMANHVAIRKGTK